MKEVFAWILAVAVAVILFFIGIFIFTGALNIFLTAIGLQKITIWVSCSLLFVALLIKWFLN
ncbi:hypothetical protein P5F55_13815 [Clostridium perfringens]|uniref:hypothetical protein n=1 Tax=Clostridium perfringens TaxID=1502 RepID=UPI0034A18EED|nr:hypothetical protein [Clostridium perfringens]MDK0928438.1 hypothetical protein [Clostridium perfringens]MDM0781054.1 hypothetical protein [Clostridium perfringens]